nr:MAG: structural protein [Picornavirales sp.]
MAFEPTPWEKYWLMNNEIKTVAFSDNTNTLSVSPVVEPDSKTVNVAEATIAVERQSEVRLSDPSLIGALNPNDISTVREYLGKQVSLFSTSWATSMARGVHINSVTGEDLWTYVSAQNMWIEKLKGYYGLRATLCLRLELNGTPFHSGRLRLSYYPAADVSGPKYLSHVSNFVPVSQLPGVDIEANESSVILKIPYVSIARFIELTASPVRSWGRLYLTVASPLATGADGAQSITARCWGWMEDVELYGQSYGFVTQGPNTLMASKVAKGRRAPSDAEEKPISSFLSNASKAVGALSGIPAIAAYSGPTAWALNAMSGAASAFGWSKPKSLASVSRVYNNPTATIANANGVEPVHSLSLDADAKLRAIEDVSPNGMDEASINFIKSQFSYFNDFTYTKTASLVDPIYSVDLVPRDLLVTIGATEKYFTPIAYLGRMFAMYRGGFDVKIKMAKTALHRGKVQVSFVPGPVPGAFPLNVSAYCYRQIIDLAEGSEFCLRVPYLLPLDYVETGLRSARFYVHAITPLQAPETVSSTVVMSVYIRGAPDLQFQLPLQPDHEVYITQGPEDLINSNEVVCATIGGAQDPNLDVAFAEHSASEMINSVTQLLKRYVHISISQVSANPYISLYPWHLTAWFSSGAGDNMDTQYQSYILSAYAFYRGGMKLKLNLNNGVDFDTDAKKLSRMNAWLDPGIATDVFNLNPNTPTPSSKARGWLAQTEAFGTGTSLLVHVPYQSPFRMATVRFYKNFSDVPGFDQPRSRLVVSKPSGSGGLARSVSDDFQPLFWVGVPRMAEYAI